jgi:hypothetical protein
MKTKLGYHPAWCCHAGMLRRALRRPLTAVAAAASAGLAWSASPSAVTGSAHCSAKTPEAEEPRWKSPPPTVNRVARCLLIRP